MTGERWKAIPGWPDYEVSDLGNVCRDGRQLKPWKTRAGRWQIRLWHNRRGKAFYTYRLVALAFLGPPPFEGAEVAHKNDDKNDNALANLKWCNHQENCADRLANGRAATGEKNGAHTKPERRPCGERVGGSKLTEAAVIEIRSTAGNTALLAKKFGVTTAAIKFVRKGVTWRHVLTSQRMAA